MSDQAILFIAWGDSHVQKVAECIGESVLPACRLVLITDETTSTGALPSNIEIIRRRFVFDGKTRKAEALADLSDEFELVLFLDDDTRVLSDISLGFDKADRHGVAMAAAPHYSLADFRSFHTVMEREGVRPRGQMLYNSGVIFFDWRNKAVRAVFRDALKLAGKDEVAPWGDQPYITLAMELASFNPYTLSPSFNYRAFGELISGSIRIWHSNRPVPSGATALEPGYLHRYENGCFARVLAVPL